MANGPFRRLVEIPAEQPVALPQAEFQGLVLGALERTEQRMGAFEGRLETFEENQGKLFLGQTELTAAFGRLAPKVEKLETAARWKTWVVNVGKAALPFALGLVAHYFPELAKHLPAIVEAIGNAAMQQ